MNKTIEERKHIFDNYCGVHPIYVMSNDFPLLENKLKIVHTNTGHIYIRPKYNFHKFTENEEQYIKNVLDSMGTGYSKDYVEKNFTTKPIILGMGFRLGFLEDNFKP